MKTFTVQGSHGWLKVDETGKILEHEQGGEWDGSYAAIERFDIPEYLSWCQEKKLPETDHIDILELGYWVTGRVPPDTAFRKHVESLPH